MENIEPNEGGEPTPAAGSPSPNDIAPATPAAPSPPSGLRIEVDILCLESLARIARAIALRFKNEIPGNSCVALATPNLLSKLNVHRRVTAQIALLQKQLDDILRAATKEQKTVSETFSAGAAAIAVGVDGLKGVFKSIGEFVSELQGDEQYTPVGDKPIPESALISTVAGQLSQQGFKVLLPGILVPQPNGGKGILFQLIELSNKKELAAKISDPNDATKAAIAAVEGLFSWLQKSSEGSQQSSLLFDLIAVDGVSELLKENSAFILVPEIVASGGSYLTRRTFLTTLFFGDQLSYSGGVAVSFLLLVGDSLSLKTGDTLYYSTGHTKFPRRYNLFKGDNLEA